MSDRQFNNKVQSSDWNGDPATGPEHKGVRITRARMNGVGEEDIAVYLDALGDTRQHEAEALLYAEELRIDNGHWFMLLPKEDPGHGAPKGFLDMVKGAMHQIPELEYALRMDSHLLLACRGDGTFLRLCIGTKDGVADALCGRSPGGAVRRIWSLIKGGPS